MKPCYYKAALLFLLNLSKNALRFLKWLQSPLCNRGRLTVCLVSSVFYELYTVKVCVTDVAEVAPSQDCSHCTASTAALYPTVLRRSSANSAINPGEWQEKAFV